jgi:hypothetical protein
MTMTLRAQRLDREPILAAGVELVCDNDGTEVRLRVTSAQPPLHDGRWVNGLVGGKPAVVWVTW